MKKLLAILAIVLLPAFVYAGPSVSSSGGGSSSFDWSGTTEARLAGVTNSVQTQLNIISGTSGGAIPVETDAIALAALTAQTDAFSSGGTNFVKSGVTPAFINQVGSVSGVSLFLLSDVTAPYVNSLTSSAQAQLDLKQPLDAQLTDIADGTFAGNFVNTAYPWEMEEILSGTTVTNRVRLSPSMVGKAGFFAKVNSTEADWDWTDSINISGLTLPLALTTAGVTDSVATIKFDPTGSQIISGVSDTNVSGVTEAVIAGVTDYISFVISGVTHGKNATGAGYADQDDILLWKAPYPIIVKEVYGILDSGTTVLWNVMNCDTSGANCTDMLAADIQSGVTGNLHPSAWYTLSDSILAKDQWLRLDITWSGVSSSGVTTNFSGEVIYWKQRQ